MKVSVRDTTAVQHVSQATCIFYQETKMLSPHEFATLMLIRNAPDQIGHGHANLDELVQRRLVTLNRPLSGKQHAYVVTRHGEAVLRAVARVR